MKRGGTHFLLNFMSRVIGITDAKETIRASIPRRMIDSFCLSVIRVESGYAAEVSDL
jgi:hypothetical protein